MEGFGKQLTLSVRYKRIYIISATFTWILIRTVGDQSLNESIDQLNNLTIKQFIKQLNN